MRIRALAAVTAITLVAACESSTEPAPEPAVWTGDLAGAAGYEEVAGEAAAAAALTAFEIEVELVNVPAGSYEWEVAAGSCAEPGNRVGPASAYEALEPDEEGAVSGSATVGATLSATGAYHVAVFATEQSDDGDVRIDVACGDLERN